MFSILLDSVVEFYGWLWLFLFGVPVVGLVVWWILTVRDFG
jgi:hypothetical protein